MLYHNSSLGMPSLSVESKMLFRADVMFDVTCSWIFSSDFCVTFKDDLRLEVKAALKLFLIRSDSSELWSDLRIAAVFDEFVSFAFSISCVDGPGRRVKLISDNTK